jgi:hypothetical protein
LTRTIFSIQARWRWRTEERHKGTKAQRDKGRKKGTKGQRDKVRDKGTEGQRHKVRKTRKNKETKGKKSEDLSGSDGVAEGHGTGY